MDVTRVKLTRAQALFEKVYFAGEIFYITNPYSRGSSTVSRSDIFDKEGDLLGNFIGHYFDFGDGKVFEKC